VVTRVLHGIIPRVRRYARQYRGEEELGEAGARGAVAAPR
jgi:hypothetical protein